MVGGGRAGALRAAFHVDERAVVHVEAAAEQAFGKTHCGLWRQGETAGQFQRGVHQGIRIADLVHQPQLQRFFHPDGPRRHQKVPGLGQTDQARQDVDGAHVGQDAQAVEHHRKGGGPRRDDEVRRQRDGKARAERRAVHGGDDGNLKPAQALKPIVQAQDAPARRIARVPLGRHASDPVAHGADVGPRAEAAARADQHQRFDRIVGANLIDHFRIVLAQRLCQGIAVGRVGMGEDSDAIVNRQVRFPEVQITVFHIVSSGTVAA
ncbi:hypothetical protein D3C71_1153130 [compost metagenome]